MINNILILPNEIIMKIFNYLDLISQNILADTCLYFYNFYNIEIKHNMFLNRYTINEWVKIIFCIKKNISHKYKLCLNNKIKQNYLFIIINNDNISVFDFYEKENYKFIQIKNFIKYINKCDYKTIVFFTHKIKLPINMNYVIFKNRQS